VSYILFLQDSSARDSSITGGKGASLAEMVSVGFPVPGGFVLTAETYKTFSDKGIPKELEKEILAAFDKIGAERVAVRSSATVEDSQSASWAGQFETYLNISREDLIQRVGDCWRSVESERVNAYADAASIDKSSIAVAVVVQKMVDSEVSGVCFTAHPVSQDENQLVIEAAWGLGEALVQGIVTPDNYVVDKEKLEIIEANTSPQEKMIVNVEKETEEVKIPQSKREEQKLNETQIKELSKICVDIEKHYGKPQDIEWAYEKGKFYITQSRPITTL